MSKKAKFFLIQKIVLLLCLDVVLIQVVSFLSLYIRFEFSFINIPTFYLQIITDYWFFNTIIAIVIFIFFRLYLIVWRFASVSEFLNIIAASIIITVIQIAVMYILNARLPRSYHFLFMILLIAGLTGIRFSYRFFLIIYSQIKKISNVKSKKRIMLFGAGQAGEVILKELNKDITKKVCCIVDDNPSVWGKYLRGVKICGDRKKIPALVSKYKIEEIIISVPSVSKEELTSIVNVCSGLECHIKILPGIYQLIDGEVNISMLRNVEIEDLLGRDPIVVDMNGIMAYVSKKTVLVTGGGGSIGSELCRQIALYKPKMIIILDIYENNAYDILNEMNRNHPDLFVKALIASVRDKNRIDKIFEEYKPDIVFHAAAHKHVPLMEDSPCEAIKNNVFGTFITANAAKKYGAKKFVLISTDKAVNPTNIMGASKRISEMIIQSLSKKSSTEFVAVRFGNVLGSNGSVIPLFKKQISEGGPVTVTHPDIIRYFMTIEEAVSLVLQAGAFAKGGEIFVLDMGDPVNITDLAKNLIRLSGYSEEEIKIVYTGLRPGEKLYEEMLMEEEGLTQTDNKLIHIGKPIDFDYETFETKLRELNTLIKENPCDIRSYVKELVPTYIENNNN